MRPVAVLVEYKDWLNIEKLLHKEQTREAATGLADYADTIQLNEDPLQFQERIRGEWH